jgi:hypothetical protein
VAAKVEGSAFSFEGRLVRAGNFSGADRLEEGVPAAASPAVERLGLRAGETSLLEAGESLPAFDPEPAGGATRSSAPTGTLTVIN